MSEGATNCEACVGSSCPGSTNICTAGKCRPQNPCDVVTCPSIAYCSTDGVNTECIPKKDQPAPDASVPDGSTVTPDSGSTINQEDASFGNVNDASTSGHDSSTDDTGLGVGGSRGGCSFSARCSTTFSAWSSLGLFIGLAFLRSTRRRKSSLYV